MEEKERFELFGEHCIKDNSPDARPQLLDACVACVILNEQDKKIKEKEKEANTYAKEIVFLDNKIKQLKKSQNQKAIEELEKLKENAWQAATDIFQLIDYAELYKIINSQIKSLKGEE